MTPDEALRRLVGAWIDKAEQDIGAAGDLLSVDTHFLYSVCFHAQQATEKYLKALLVWHGLDAPKTHDISLLLQRLASHEAGLVDRVRDADLLTRYAVDIRYPGEQPEPNREEADRALELASMVRDAVLRALPAGE